MKIDTTAHVRITPLTDCGCRPAGEPTVLTDVPVYLVDEPQIVDDVATAYSIEFQINGLPPTLPEHAMIETWVATNRHIAVDAKAPTQWASVALRHLVNGDTAQPWSPCPDHGGIAGDTGPAITLTATWTAGPHDFPGWN